MKDDGYREERADGIGEAIENAGPTEWIMDNFTIEVHDRVVALDF